MGVVSITVITLKMVLWFAHVEKITGCKKMERAVKVCLVTQIIKPIRLVLLQKLQSNDSTQSAAIFYIKCFSSRSQFSILTGTLVPNQ